MFKSIMPKDNMTALRAAKELARGAEALLTVENEEVVKERIKKGYRIPQLDNRLRAERTRAEARLMNGAARAGVSVPKILGIEEKQNKIIMEFVEGKLVKEAIAGMNEDELKLLAEKIGRVVGKLHSAGIVHGDLTTSNMILRDDNLFFIDFGLGQFSSHPEDQGVDLAVLHESIRAAHFKQLDIIWPKLIDAYKMEFPAADKVLKALHNIERRGRYVKRE